MNDGFYKSEFRLGKNTLLVGLFGFFFCCFLLLPVILVLFFSFSFNPQHAHHPSTSVRALNHYVHSSRTPLQIMVNILSGDTLFLL